MRHPHPVYLIWILAVGCLTLTPPTRAALPAYLHIDFETAGGWNPGVIHGAKSGLQIIQGSAAIVSLKERDSSQVLELGPSSPFPAVFVDSLPVAKAPIVFCEFLVKPAAVDSDSDAEFFDLGGATLGFFKADARGEVRALFNRSNEESVWISTGAHFDLDTNSRAADWLRITVRLDRKTERWDLKINGKKALSGLRAAKGEPAGLRLWLYGQEFQSCQFDDILISAVDPDQLERMIDWRKDRGSRGKAQASHTSEPRVVPEAKRPAQLRSAQPTIRNASGTLVEPVLRSWGLTLKTGDSTYTPQESIIVNGESLRAGHFTPQYDEAGNPLPGTITLTADAELRPGAELRHIHWAIARFVKEVGPQEMFDVGDFSTGLVQTITIPPEWMRVSLTARVWYDTRDVNRVWREMKAEAEAAQE
jgi:hypothetical protein